MKKLFPFLKNFVQFQRMVSADFSNTSLRGSGVAKRPLVISGPSGCGKSTLLHKLFAKYPDAFGFSVSHTSRAPRKGEIPGKSYHFVSRDAFLKLKEEDGFIETAEFSGNLYGTSKQAVADVSNKGQICVLDIELTGVKAIKVTELKAIYILIRPPSFEELERRLRGRDTDSEEAILKRLETARHDLHEAETCQPRLFDCIVTNHDLEKAFAELEEIVLANYSENDLHPKAPIENEQTSI